MMFLSMKDIYAGTEPTTQMSAKYITAYSSLKRWENVSMRLIKHTIA